MQTLKISTGYDYMNGKRIPLTTDIQAGDFLSESLVTDTIVYEVVKVTAQTATIRHTDSTGTTHEDPHCDKGANGLSVQWEGCKPNPDAETRRLHIRKDGTLRIGNHTGARPLRPTRTIDGQPVARRDWRF